MKMKDYNDYTDVIEVTDKLNRQTVFNDYVTERLYEWATDPYEECPTVLDPSTEDRYYLVEATDGVLVVEPDGREWEFGSAIVQENDLGGVEATYFNGPDGAYDAWNDIERRTRAR